MVLSVLDLKDAFYSHSHRLSQNSKRYCGILPCFGSDLYLQSRKYCEAIMDDLLLFTLKKKSHIAKLEDLLKTLLKNGLKIFP